MLFSLKGRQAGRHRQSISQSVSQSQLIYIFLFSLKSLRSGSGTRLFFTYLFMRPFIQKSRQVVIITIKIISNGKYGINQNKKKKKKKKETEKRE